VINLDVFLVAYDSDQNQTFLHSPQWQLFLAINSHLAPWEGRKDPGAIFRQFVNRQEAVNLNPASLQTQEREAVVISLPISMHTGQIFLLTKLLTASDLRFYEFEADAPVERWRFDASRSS
jgi:hypothetical protein